MESKKSTFSTCYYINRNPKRIDSENRCMVNVRISVNGTHATSSIQRKIKIKEWNPKGGGRPLQGKSDEAANLADYMRKLETKMLQVYENLMRTETYFTAEMVKSHVFGTQKDNNISVLSLFQEKMEKEKKLIEAKKKSRGNYARFFYCHRYLAKFLKTEYGLDDILFRKIDKELINKFEEYLSLRPIDRCKKKKLMRDSSIKALMQKFKNVVMEAIDRKIIQDNPFKDMHLTIDFSKSKRCYLTEDELILFMTTNYVKEYLEEEKKFFSFCCFTGLSDCDFRSLKRENIEKENGKWWVRTYRNKTDLLSNIPLLPQAEAILRDFYPNWEVIPYNTVLFQSGCYGARRLHLKEMVKISGISKNVTTHIARHSNCFF